MKQMKKLAMAVGVAGVLGLSGVANAEEIFVDTGYDQLAAGGGTDGNGYTDDFDALAFNPVATSAYTYVSGGTGGGTDNLLEAGEVWNFTDIGDIAVLGFVTNGGVTLLGEASEFYGAYWELSVKYSVEGTATYVGDDTDLTGVSYGDEFAAGQGFLPTFTGGTLEVFATSTTDPSNSGTFGGLGTTEDLPIKVLELDMNSGPGVLLGNVLLGGETAWAWDPSAAPPAAAGTADWLIQNMFNYADGTPFYLVDTAWRIDFNVDLNLIPFLQAGLGNAANETGNVVPQPDCAAGTICRASSLNIEMRFTRVPLPGTLALFGLGLIGLGASSLKRRRSVA